MIDFQQFKKYAVRPICKEFQSPFKAEKCLMAFAAHESLGGKYMQQIRGPAMGPYQMEPPTKKLVDRWILRQGKLDIEHWGTDLYWNAPLEELRTDLKCATWYARILLLADPYPLPGIEDWEGIYRTYRRVWGPGKPPSYECLMNQYEVWRRA